MRAGLALIFMAFVCSFIAFQSSLLWFPPTLPASLLIIGALVGRILGKKAPATPVPPGKIMQSFSVLPSPPWFCPPRAFSG